ncbi:MAG TPA: hypothetical protein VNS58_27225 [Puia sp.]|nr:hypothetical protein [Puia sp.]
MKPLSIRFTLAILAWLVFCSAFTSWQPASVSSKKIYYYFYNYPDDTINAYSDTADEEAALESVLGVTVDTNAPGGTIVVKGYSNNNYPHNVLPSVLLFAHY